MLGDDFSQYPTKLEKQEGTGHLISQKDGRTFIATHSLLGRGQEGLAGFFKENEGDSREWLIKEDDPGTCILEGTAYFVLGTDVLPYPHRDAINFAQAGSIRLMEGEKTISVQEKVAASEGVSKIFPWDVLVYGKKRNPKTLISEEEWNASKIKKNINELSSDVQWDLATAIFASQLVGDESLHVGQFMAAIDNKNRVLKIKRIDLGARERYAQQREIAQDYSPFSNSYLYQSSGQYGKDYLRYLMQSPSLKFKLASLWATSEIDSQAIERNSRLALTEQFAALSDTQKSTAYEQMLSIINKSAENPFIPKELNLEAQIIELINHLSKIDASRAVKIKEIAYEFMLSHLEEKKSILRYCPIILQRKMMPLLDWNIQSLINVDRSLTFDKIRIFHDELTALLSQNNNFKNIKISSENMLNTLETFKLINMNASEYQDIKIALDELISRYRIIDECAGYCLQTQSQEKVKLVTTALIQPLLNQNNELPNVADDLLQNKYLQEKLKEQKSILFKSNKSNGHLLLESIFKQLDLPVEKLNFSPVQLNFIRAVHGRDSQTINEIAQSKEFTIYDALVPDYYGRTALHYLMKQASCTDDYEAIARILIKSTGNVINTSVELRDNNNETPIDFLKENPNKVELIDFLEKSNILNSIYGRYSLTYFFRNTDIDDITQEPVNEFESQTFNDPIMTSFLAESHFFDEKELQKDANSNGNVESSVDEIIENFIVGGNNNQLNINAEEWEIANNFFKTNPTEVKLDKKSDNRLNHYFIKINHQIYGVEAANILGFGGFGKVKLCQNEKNQLFAVKVEGVDDSVVHDQDEYDLTKKVGLAIGEAQKKYSEKKAFLPSKSSKKLKEGEGKEISSKKFIVQKLMSNGSLKTKLSEIDNMDVTMSEKLDIKLDFMHQTIESVASVHQYRIVHADLNENNLMFDSSNHLWPIDYGLAQQLPAERNYIEGSGEGTFGYRAPEILGEKRYSFESDVYAVGHIFERSFAAIDSHRASKLVQLYEFENNLNDNIAKQTGVNLNFSSSIDMCFKNSKSLMYFSEFEFMRLMKNIEQEMISAIQELNDTSDLDVSELALNCIEGCYHKFVEEHEDTIKQYKRMADLFEPLIVRMKYDDPELRPSTFFIESIVRQIKSKRIVSAVQVAEYLNSYDKKYDNTLLGAWMLGDEVLLKKLAENEKNFDQTHALMQDDSGKTILHHLVEQDVLHEAIKNIVFNHARTKKPKERDILSISDNQGETALHLMVKHERCDLLDKLSLSSEEGYQSLRKSHQMSEILHKSSMDKNAKGQTAIDIAVSEHPKNGILINQLAQIMRLGTNETKKYHTLASSKYRSLKS